MASKRRILDVLSERFPHLSEKELYAAVMCGEIKIDGHTLRDPSAIVPPQVNVELLKPGFVSRGGEKLDYALSKWNLSVEGRVFLDAGSSTGGFTDCLLAAGAARVHAVDVGYNQLDWKLRKDSRVFVHERTNIMDLKKLTPLPDAAVADLSFRSLRGAAAKILSLTRERWCVSLIKPQFEIGRGADNFDGILRDGDTRADVVSRLLQDLRAEGVFAEKLVRSPIPGAKGNIEFLALFRDAESGESRVVLATLREICAD